MIAQLCLHAGNGRRLPNLKGTAIKIYRRVKGAFARVAELGAEAGDTLTTPLLPGFAVKLAEVFESPFPA